MDQTTPTPAAPQPPVAPQPPTPGTAPGGSNKGLIIGLIVTVVLLVLVGATIAIAFALSAGKNNNSQTNNTTTSEQPATTSEPTDERLREANAETATTLSQFDAVCENGSIANAAELKKPYKVAAFAKNSTTRSYSTVTLAYNAKYRAEYGKHEAVNIVGCLEEKAGSAVKSKTCDFKSSGKKVKLDYYALKYTLTLHEAKTGKVLKTAGEVNAPATTCPYFVAYDKSDPKYYAKPDSGAVDAAVKKYLAEL